ncbi:MAG: PAS domain S-box protein, partial [Bacteroidota bacterium]
FGHKREDIVGKYLWEVLGEDAYQGLVPHFERVFVGEQVSFESWIPYKDGGSRYVHVSYLPDFGADGQVKGFFAQVNDLTELKRQEMEREFLLALGEKIRFAERSEALLDEVCELTARHFGVSNCAFTEVFVEKEISVANHEYRSENAVSVLGTFPFSNYPKEVVDALRAGRLVAIDDTKTDLLTASFYEIGYESFGFRALLVQPVIRDHVWVGSLFLVSNHIRHWTQADVALIGVIAERTWLAMEKLRSQEILRESEARFRTLADSAPVLIWVNGADGGCEFVNKAYLDFFGKRMEEVQGFGWQPSLHPGDEGNYVGTYLEAFNARAPFRCQARLKNRNGEYRWVDSFGLPRFSASGEFLGYVGTSPDITGIKEAAEALRTKNKELEHFAYITSHDLQEPVNTIFSFIELIESELPPDENLSQSIGFIKDSCGRMSRLITDLLEHSRIGRTSQPQQVDMRQLVGEVLRDMDGSLKAKSAEIEVGKLPTLTAYPTEMRLLFQNLFSNSLKFQKPGGMPRINVTAAQENAGGGWHFVVEDNGIGIEEKFHERIFTIFQRLHPAHKFDGTGIGLAHCKKIVELHRGRIWVESEVG